MAKKAAAVKSITPMVEQLKDKLDIVIEEAVKFDRGVNVAGSRARKGLQEIKAAIKGVRDAITETKNIRKAAK
jgi:hypothetical protein